MSETNFDHLPERQGTGAIKWDRFPGYRPFWVADMDFLSPDCVVEAIQSRTAHGIFGYAHAHEGLVSSVLAYLKTIHGVEAEADELVHLPGMVPALSMACRAFAEPGDQIMINSPVYYPFFHVAADAGAETVAVPHIRDSVTWRFDWEAMEAAVTPSTKLLILCNPQNPLGRVFSEQEVLHLAEFCERHDLILVADEIHCDLILDPDQKHYSALRLREGFQQRLITLMAPSKTYNIAGLGYSFAVIKDPELRRRFVKAKGCTLPEINALSMYAAEAAYRDGEPWRQSLVQYLRENRDALATFVRQEMPSLSIHEHSATYLYWIDCSALGLSHPSQFFAEKANVFLTDGTPFGSRQHVRFNFGCPRWYMLEGLEEMRTAIKEVM